MGAGRISVAVNPTANETRWVCQAGRMPQLVTSGLLFDLDGTLLDSTASVERCWKRLAEGIGMPWDDIKDEIHGVPVRQVLARLRPDMDPAEVEQWHQFMVEAESTDTGDVMPIPGAITALEGLPSNRWAIVTSGGLRLATSRRTAAGIPAPRYLVTADDVRVGKPDPAPYVMGATRLGLVGKECVAFEDSPAGVASALAAQCQVIGLTTHHADLGVPMIDDFTGIEFSADRAGVIITW